MNNLDAINCNSWVILLPYSRNKGVPNLAQATYYLILLKTLITNLVIFCSVHLLSTGNFCLILFGTLRAVNIEDRFVQKFLIFLILLINRERVCSARYWGRAKVYRGEFLGKYPTRVLGKVRYGLNTRPNTPVGFGTTSIPVPDTSVTSTQPLIPVPNTLVRACRGYFPYQSGSVRPQYPTEHSVMVQCEFHPGTGHFGKFGTTSIPVPDNWVTSVRPPKTSRVPVLYTL